MKEEGGEPNMEKATNKEGGEQKGTFAVSQPLVRNFPSLL